MSMTSLLQYRGPRKQICPWSEQYTKVLQLLELEPLDEWGQSFVNNLLTVWQPKGVLTEAQRAKLGSLSYQHLQNKQIMPRFWWNGQLDKMWDEYFSTDPDKILEESDEIVI